jgi:ADP-ribose pyrophosphatase YjhB (NUDIX family)
MNIWNCVIVWTAIPGSFPHIALGGPMIPACLARDGGVASRRQDVGHHWPMDPTAPTRPWYRADGRPEIAVPACPNCAHRDASPGEEPALRCANCGWYWYPNPRPTAAVIIERPDGDGGLEFLLLRRAVEPASGWWDLPAGFLEPRETPDEGALREAREEAGFEVELTGLIGAYASRESNTVVFAYTARPVDPDAIAEPDHESSESRWVRIADVDAALPSVAFVPIQQAIAGWRALRSAAPVGEGRAPAR